MSVKEIIKTDDDLIEQKTEKKDALHRVISVFGEKNQKMQAIEELIELQKELFENVHRGSDNRDAIVEEIADVEIMIKQLRLIFNINETEIANIKAKKVQRLEHTIEKYLAKQQDKISTEKQEIIIDREMSNGH